MPELAVVIPAYTEEKNIEKNLNAWLEVLNKLKIDFEIHVYNDGSLDRTKEIVENFSAKNQRVVLHDQKKWGMDRLY